MPLPPTGLNSKILRDFSKQYPIIVRRYRSQYRWFQSSGFTALAFWMVYCLRSCSGLGIDAHIELSDLICFIGIQAAFFITSILLLVSAESAEDNLNTATLVSSIINHLHSNKHYILMLRSFRSQLVAETVERVRPVVREEFRIMRGELMPTGKKYEDYTSKEIYSNTVSDFLVSCSPELHVIHINGAASILTAAPLSLISTDEHWWEVFNILVRGAAAVVVVPECSASLAEEIRSVMVSFHQKALILMPPSVEDEGIDDGTWLSGSTRKKQWNEIRKQLLLELPEYTAEGMILLCSQESPQRLERYPYSPKTVAAFADMNALHSLSMQKAVCQLEDTGLLRPTIVELERLARELM